MFGERKLSSLRISSLIFPSAQRYSALEIVQFDWRAWNSLSTWSISLGSGGFLVDFLQEFYWNTIPMPQSVLVSGIQLSWRVGAIISAVHFRTVLLPKKETFYPLNINPYLPTPPSSESCFLAFFLQIALVQKVHIDGISWSFLWVASYTSHLLMVHPCCSMNWYLIPSHVKFHWMYIAHCVHVYVWVVPTSSLLWLVLHV